MAHFAHITNGIVDQVIVIDEATLATGAWGNPSEFVETFMDGGVRKNFAGIGMVYDSIRDVFYYPKIHDSWTLNEETAQWIPPAPMPLDCGEFERAVWNEAELKWDICEGFNYMKCIGDGYYQENDEKVADIDGKLLESKKSARLLAQELP